VKNRCKLTHSTVAKIYILSVRKTRDTCNKLVLVIGEYDFSMAVSLTSDMDSRFVFTEFVVVSQH
jgi:hypothetical protein